MNLIELLNKPIRLMSPDELLVMLPVGLLLFFVWAVAGMKVIDLITRSWRDSAPEDEAYEGQSDEQDALLDDLDESFARRKYGVTVWALFQKPGVRLTDFSTTLIQIHEMTFLNIYADFDTAWEDFARYNKKITNRARVDFTYNEHPAVLFSCDKYTVAESGPFSYLFIEMNVVIGGQADE